MYYAMLITEEEEKSRRRKDNLTFQWKGCVLLKPPRDPSDIGGKMATGAKYEDAPPPYSEMPPPWTGSQTNGSPACLPQPSGIYLIPVGSHCPTSIFYPPPYSDLPSCAPPYSNVPPTAITGLPLNRDTMDSSCIPESPATCDDHMTRSILSLFLCLPLGIVALIYSFKTRASNKKGDREAAADHSGKSHKLNKICLFGLLVYITLISFAIVKYILHRHHLIGSL
ncbi:uncharacterized protein ACMZJ9_019144 [Mantella aurantiaca]